jgi:hypothetical protein
VAPLPSIKIIKSFPYEGATKQFSNRYHFTGGTPADSAHWAAMLALIYAQEKLIYGSEVTIIGATGYDAGSDLPVYSNAASIAGTYSPGATTVRAPGDCVAIGRWSTAARTSKNHPVYLFSYWHGVYRDPSSADMVAGDQQTKYGVYMNEWDTVGFSDGVNTYKRGGPNGASATGHVEPTVIRHRDFPR